MPRRGLIGYRPDVPILNADFVQELGIRAVWPLNGYDWRDLRTQQGPSSRSGVVLSPSGLGGLVADFGDYFNASSLTYPVMPSYQVSSFTMLCWYNCNATSSDTVWNGKAFLSRWNGIGNASFYWGPITGSGFASFTMEVGLHNGSSTKIKTTTNTFTNRFINRRLGITFDGTTLRWYVDGVELENTTDTVVPMTTSTIDLVLGREPGSGTTNIPGAMSDVVLAGRAWTPTELWRDFDPATRWDLYWQKRKTYFVLSGGVGPSMARWASSLTLLGAA